MAKGFTILELLVVLAVTTIVGAMVFPSWRKGQDSLTLEREAHKLAQDIRRTMELNLRAQDSTACDPGSGSFSGYGIYFSAATPTSYIIYANCSGVGPGPGYKTSGGDQDVVVETISLSESVEINSVTVASGDDWSIAFYPPEPLIALCGNDACLGVNDFETASVTLELTNDPSKTKIVTVNDRGLIDVD